MRIKLIGRPQIIDDDGRVITVPGQQPWAVLARLLLADGPIGRRQIASELFCETDDPLGALRWCLAALRRALGPETLRSDPIELNLPKGVIVDISSVGMVGGKMIEPAGFLEGIEPAASVAFSTWLLVSREQIASQIHQHFRRSAIEALARGNPATAMKFAECAIRTQPLDESGHILLVKALAMAGKPDAALAHISATEKDFEQSLGERPTKALRLAARANVADAPKGVSQAAIVESLIKSGTAAVAAGAIDAGLDCLRQAAAKSEAGTDGRLISRTFHELGSALVHSIRGFDDEGAIMLRRAADRAMEVGASSAAAASLRELGYVEALAGRRPAAAEYLNEALEYADGDDEALAGIHAIMGFNLVDWGKVHLGLSHFEQSLAFARKCGNQRREIWALGIGGWGQIRGGHAAVADEWLTSCIAKCEEVRWVAFQPWPQAMLFEARLMLGRIDNSASIALDEALALSSQLGDPCWEAANARAIALLHEDSGDLTKSIEWLNHARERCCSVTDLYAGLMVEILADQQRIHQKLDCPEKASSSARELVSLAARTHADAHIKAAMVAVSEIG